VCRRVIEEIRHSLARCAKVYDARLEVVMKPSWMLAAILTIPLTPGCKAKGSGEGQAAASASAETAGAVRASAAATAKARIGGTVIAAGDYAVEVLLHAGGRVEALVMNAKGDLFANPEKVKLDLTVQAKAGARAKIDMKWDPPKARFVGQAAAGVEIAPGAVDVALDIDGKANAGAAAMVALSAEAIHGGQIIVAGDYSIELVPQGELVYAFAFDASGKAHVAGDLALDLDIGGKTFAFAWDAPTMSYKAKLDAGVDLDAKPVALKLTAGGKVALGAVASFKADARANLDAALYAKAKLEGDARAKVGAALDVKAPELSAQVSGAKTVGASAKARVEAPAPTVKASASKSAGVSAGTGTGAKASAGAKAGFSFGTK
jgi:hypothetical protein